MPRTKRGISKRDGWNRNRVGELCPWVEFLMFCCLNLTGRSNHITTDAVDIPPGEPTFRLPPQELRRHRHPHVGHRPARLGRGPVRACHQPHPPEAKRHPLIPPALLPPHEGLQGDHKLAHPPGAGVQARPCQIDPHPTTGNLTTLRRHAHPTRPAQRHGEGAAAEARRADKGDGGG